MTGLDREGLDPTYRKSDLPEGRSGDWTLERFTLRDHPSYEATRDPRPAFARRRAGTFTKLCCGPVHFMTDLYDEWWTQRVVVEQARRRGGRLLISGLGLGLILESVLGSEDIDVERITVLEKSPDVIKLVAPHLEARYGSRLEILEADVFTWSPPAGERYSIAWHDIWPSPYEVEAEVAGLRERYEPWADWIGSWPEEYLLAYAETSVPGLAAPASAPASKTA